MTSKLDQTVAYMKNHPAADNLIDQIAAYFKVDRIEAVEILADAYYRTDGSMWSRGKRIPKRFKPMIDAATNEWKEATSPSAGNLAKLQR